MSLPAQKYPNIERTVSGTVNVDKFDVVLNVTTSSVAATINLQEFENTIKWSTQYKLYVRDDSNNAATNNITIVAPAGYTINGGPSAVINANGGSAIVRIVGNTSYQAQLSSFSNTSLPMPYLYSKKLLQTAITTYIPVASGGVNSVSGGTAIATYDSTVNSNISGFNSTTGVWTVAVSGYYAVGAKMITRINDTDVNSVTNGSGTFWMTLGVIDGGVGYISIAVTQRSGGGAVVNVVTAEKQVVTQAISDVNIECAQTIYYFTAGDQVEVQVLNKTNYAIVGIPSRAGQPDCIIDFSATKIS